MSRQQHLTERGLAYACTDIGNSERFVAMHGTSLRYVPEERRERRWLAHDGTRWTTENADPLRRAKETAKGIWDEAKNCANSQGQAELGRWAQKSEFAHRLHPMLSLAAVSMGVSITAFDTEPTKLNCLNGIVDLENGQLIRHSPDQLIMKRANVRYVPTAKSDTWATFLKEVFLSDDALIEYVQRALGYSITGLTNEHAMFIAYGLGANGKGTLFETVLDILGDYGMTTEFSTFLNTEKRDVRVQEAIGRLKGARFAIASETDSTRKWDEALAKKLTGGDTLIGAKLHGDAFEFKPTHKLWFQANHLPGFKDASHGFLRRVRVIPFRAKFEGSAIDPTLRTKLLKERDAIFAWLVEGARQYLKGGLQDTPKAVADATSAYISDNDTLGRFITERLLREPKATVGSRETYQAYSLWCSAQHEAPQDEKFFAKAMEERGIAKKRVAKGVVFLDHQLAGAANDNGATNHSDRREVRPVLPF